MSQRTRCALIVGTRPEAIKLAPLYRALDASGRLEPLIVSTGQHSELLDGAFRALGLPVHHDLGLMRHNQTPAGVSAQILETLPPILESTSPRAVVVQGDTTTALAAALVAYYARIPIGHVEAGLRSYDLDHPFPEEGNRQMIDRLSRWCFAPTESAIRNLIAERIPEGRVHLTGNTAIDSILWALDGATAPPVATKAPFVLVTLHRRESFGETLREILLGVCQFVRSVPDARVIWPVHPNPMVRETAAKTVAGEERIELMEPVPYKEFVMLMRQSRLILTDSGGIQEEAPSLGKRALVVRETTERPEAIEAGLNWLVGRRADAVFAALRSAWEEPVRSPRIPVPSPYSDGEAGRRIAALLADDLAT